MSLPHLTLNETRVIGSLLEKAVTTPEQCPLTLNALMTACNQKSSRDPVLSLDQGTVQRTARDLEEKLIVTSDENPRTGVVKYRHRFCNTPFSDLQLTEAEYAVVCVLLLRGPQTPGELRTRASRLYEFADNEAVVETLRDLLDADRPGGALVARLARVPGRRDHQYAHRFSGDVESVPEEERVERPTSPRRNALAELQTRVEALEREVAALRQERASQDGASPPN